MKKFSIVEKEDKLDKKDGEKVLWKNDIMKVHEIDGWTVTSEADSVVCIPFIVEENVFFIRQEYIPTYKYVTEKDLHLTIISGTMEEGESPEDTLRRELEEEAGIRLRENFPIEFDPPLFTSKGSTNQFHPCLLQLTKNDFTEVVSVGDGTVAEDKSKTIKVNAKYIKDLKSSDIITELLLTKLKIYLNID